VVKLFAMPMKGLAMSLSVNPNAFNSAL
jgi:hypothetical protein